MKKLFLILVSVILMLNSVVVFADSPYSEFIATVEEKSNIDISQIDEENVFVAEITNHLMMQKGKAPTRFFLMMPSKDSDDLFASYFESGVYVLTETNFSAVAPLKDFDKNTLASFLSNNSLAEPTEIKALIIFERMHMFAYNVVCDGINYIIPYHFTNESLFNAMENEECYIETGKAYTVDEFTFICEKEHTLYEEYMNGVRNQEKEETPHITTDNDGELVVNEGKVPEGTPDIEDNAPVEENEEDVAQPDISDEEDVADNKEDEIPEEDEKDIAPPENPTDPEEPKEPVTFIDVPMEHWAYSEITTLAGKGIILGYGDGYFGVNDSVTYEHLSLLLDRLFNYKENNIRSIPAIREDIVVSLVKAMGADVSSADTTVINEKFNDCETIKEENKEYIAYAIECGLVVGYNGNMFPDDNVTRAETATLLYRTMQLIK